MLEEEERKQVQDLLRQLLTVRVELTDVAKVLSRLQDETIELYRKLDDRLDED